MNTLLGAKKTIDRCIEAIVDLQFDMPHLESGKLVSNFDFALLHPYQAHPAIPDHGDDVLNLVMFNNFVNNRSRTKLNLVMSRATIVEMLQHIFSKIQSSRAIRGSSQNLALHRRRLAALKDRLGFPRGQHELDLHPDSTDYLFIDGMNSSAQLAKEIQDCYSFLPEADNFKGLEKITDLMKSGDIMSFYEVFDRSEIRRHRGEISELSGEIQRSFHYRPGEVNPENKSINLAVDARNIASAIALNGINETQVTFNGPRYNVSHEGYRNVWRGPYYLAIWNNLVNQSSTFSNAKLMTEKMKSDAIFCKTLTSKYNNTGDTPIDVLKEVAAFMEKYITPMRTIEKGGKNPRDMYERILKKTSSDGELVIAMEEAEESFAQRARNIVEAMDYTGDLLDETDLSKNPRVMQVLKEFGLE